MEVALIVILIVPIVVGIYEIVSGRVIFNPTQIDWSAGEARALGATSVAPSLTLLAWLQMANVSLAGWPFLLFVLLGAVGMVGVILVGRRHNGRNPRKRWTGFG